MTTIVDRVRNAFKLNAGDSLAQQSADLREQSLAYWRKAVQQAATGKQVALLDLQGPALNIGITPSRLPSVFEADVRAWQQEVELAASAVHAEKQNVKQTIIAEQAAREVAVIESRWHELRRLAASAFGSGVQAGEARSRCDRHRTANARLWDDASRNDPKAAAAALELPAEDVPPAVTTKRTNNDEAEWIVDEK